MSNNRRRNDNPVEFASIVKWTLFAAILGGFGLCYVYLKVQMHAYGRLKNQLESEYDGLVVQNQAIRGQITTMTSRAGLQRRVDDGFITLVAIPDTQIVRIQPARANPGNLIESEILPVSIQSSALP